MPDARSSPVSPSRSVANEVLQRARSKRRGRRLFVTGGSGFLGRHVVNGPDAERWELIAPDSHGLDLRNASSVRSVIRDWRPTAVIHTAYRKDDPAAVVDATRHVAEAARAVGARLVHVSTDAVFAGQIAAYREGDPPHPVTEYGELKAAAEALVAEIDPTAVIVRTSLILGRREPSVHEQMVRDAIAEPDRFTFFTDEIRSPVLADDLASALVQLAGRRDVSGPLHLGGPHALSRAELAVLVAERHGWDPHKLRFGTLAGTGLVRPTRVVLDSSLARSLGIGVRGPRSW